MISESKLESKLDDSFPIGRFFLDGFGTTFGLDQDKNGGVIILFIRNDIPAKDVSTDHKPIESFSVELNFRKKKWLLNNPKWYTENCSLENWP